MEQIQYINFKGKFVNNSKSFVKSYIQCIFGHSTKNELSIYDEFSFILETSIILLAPCVKKKDT